MGSGAEERSSIVRFRDFARSAPAWFWAAMIVGALIRVYLVFCTEGTFDVNIWRQHASGVGTLGLIDYYRSGRDVNHPPLMLLISSLLLKLADNTGTPFAVWLRLPFAVLDIGTTMLLVLLLRPRPWRLAAGACYWLHPLALIFSAFHGNTDTSVPFFLLLSVWCLAEGNAVAGGIALGIGLWIKLPGALAIPALLILAPGWRNKAAFLCALGITGISSFLPALAQDPNTIFKCVFGYHGQLLQTTGGVAFWGIGRLLDGLNTHFLLKPAEFLVFHGWQIGVASMLLLTLLRRSRRSASDVCVTIAGGYALLLGFTGSWSFQYLAWSLPFWFFCGAWFVALASFFASGYIYSLYWLYCGNPWLYGKWDFFGHPYWPEVVVMFRNLANLFFLFSGLGFLISAAVQCIRLKRGPAAPVSGAG